MCDSLRVVNPTTRKWAWAVIQERKFLNVGWEIYAPKNMTLCDPTSRKIFKLQPAKGYAHKIKKMYTCKGKCDLRIPCLLKRL